jgi:hypothetical protein
MKLNNKYMIRLFSKLVNGIAYLIELAIKYIFLLCSEKKQNYLIEKNAIMFWGLQNLAKKCDDDGDVRGAMAISSESYEYLGKFALYCNAKEIDQVKRLHIYAPYVNGDVKNISSKNYGEDGVGLTSDEISELL